MTAFRELSVNDRIKTLQSEGLLSENETRLLLEQQAESSRTNIPADIANHMIEHQIGKYTLPVGVVRNLIVNNEKHNVLLATEEPSVIAAACNGARITAMSLEHGIIASSPSYMTTVQIVFEDYDGTLAKRLEDVVNSRKDEILNISDKAHPSIVERGGGARKCRVEALKSFAKLSIDVDTKDAMGANIVNTIGEAVKAQLESWLGCEALVAILTNTSRHATVAEVHLPTISLASNKLPESEKASEGARLARRVAALSAFAAADPERAATHNKGILNGIAGAALASGNDTRALEASAHAWAAHSGSYLPLSTWSIQEYESQETLYGRIEIPLQIGIVGGSITSLPMAQIAIHVGKYKTSNEYRNVLAALGLVQNLAALRALAGPGIQEGHMRLQSANIAIAAGAKGVEIEEITNKLAHMKDADRNAQTAEKLLKALRDLNN